MCYTHGVKLGEALAFSNRYKIESYAECSELGGVEPRQVGQHPGKF
jgi:hypothetical protein